MDSHKDATRELAATEVPREPAAVGADPNRRRRRIIGAVAGGLVALGLTFGGGVAVGAALPHGQQTGGMTAPNGSLSQGGESAQGETGEGPGGQQGPGGQTQGGQGGTGAAGGQAPPAAMG